MLVAALANCVMENSKIKMKGDDGPYISCKNDLKLYLPEAWSMTEQKWSFPSVTDEQLFQDHLPTKTIISTQNSVSLETWTMNVKFPS